MKLLKNPIICLLCILFYTSACSDDESTPGSEEENFTDIALLEEDPIFINFVNDIKESSEKIIDTETIDQFLNSNRGIDELSIEEKEALAIAFGYQNYASLETTSAAILEKQEQLDKKYDLQQNIDMVSSLFAEIYTGTNFKSASKNSDNFDPCRDCEESYLECIKNVYIRFNFNLTICGRDSLICKIMELLEQDRAGKVCNDEYNTCTQENNCD